MATFVFGSGTAWFTRTDITPATPRYFAAMQDIEVDFDSTIQRAFGQYQMPLDVARGQQKITGKAKTVNVQGRMMADLFFNETMTSGYSTTNNSEAGTVGAGPYTITPTNAAQFVTDLGVRYASSGVPLEKVTAAPTVAGTYRVQGTGVYAFAAADASLGMKVSYVSTVAGAGQSFIMNNQAMGVSPQFGMTLEMLGKTKKVILILNACVAAKLTAPTKLDNYMIQELDFEGFADASNVVGSWGFNEVN